MSLWLVRGGKYGEHESKFIEENKIFFKNSSDIKFQYIPETLTNNNNNILMKFLEDD